jgi:pseudaminic acid synthase
MKIGNCEIGIGHPTFIVAELSANHNQDINIAIELIHQAKLSGADAIKMQTYTPDTITLNCDNDFFKIKGTHLWDNQTLYQLYQKAYTPWDWFPKLQKETLSLGMEFFSSPFDTTAVDFLETLNVPCYKIASAEITDHILIKKIAQTKKPVIISSGMASMGELEEAITVLRKNGTTDIAMLKCTAEYPAKPDDANLMTIQHMMSSFNVIGGLSDHTLGITVPVCSVVMGASIIEKHFTLSRSSGSPDDAFSLTPSEFKEMVDAVRIAEKVSGKITYGGVKGEQEMKKFRRSLFFCKDINKGEIIDSSVVRSIRPGDGLHTKYYDEIIGKKTKCDIKFGTPVAWNLLE